MDCRSRERNSGLTCASKLTVSPGPGSAATGWPDRPLVEGAGAEFGGEARGRVRPAAPLEGLCHGLGEAGALGRGTLPQLAACGDDRAQPGGADT
jgi:hypothetical protein